MLDNGIGRHTCAYPAGPPEILPHFVGRHQSRQGLPICRPGVILDVYPHWAEVVYTGCQLAFFHLPLQGLSGVLKRDNR